MGTVGERVSVGVGSERERAENRGSSAEGVKGANGL